jgi:hypothetical protein
LQLQRVSRDSSVPLEMASVVLPSGTRTFQRSCSTGFTRKSWIYSYRLHRNSPFPLFVPMPKKEEEKGALNCWLKEFCFVFDCSKLQTTPSQARLRSVILKSCYHAWNLVQWRDGS